MKRIEFERSCKSTNFYTIEILDEDLLSAELIEWFKKHDDISVWCLENEHFTSVKMCEEDYHYDEDEDYDLSISILEELNINKELYQ
jgi:hypothetical protein